MNSEVGLIIQLVGICLIAVLFVFLTNTLKSDALRYWRSAWLSLACALIFLYVAFTTEVVAKPFFALYYFCEYLFAYLLISGCRNYSSGEKIAARKLWLLVPAWAVAIFLSFPIGEFNDVFNFHSFIMSAYFTVAFLALKSSEKFSRDNSGWRVMKAALALLALDFFHYMIIFSLRFTSYPKLLGNYLAFNSIIDLVLEILLGFGMVIVLLERVRLDVEETNHKLKEAHDKLEELAHVDPLTAAFTRHAFYSFLQKYNRETDVVFGCVGVFDIDNLKPINDRYGHSVGDVAISSVSHAIRSLVRADDLIFRWGGDEFFVVMLGFDTAQAIERMCRLNEILENIKLFGLEETVTIGVSFGFADFADIANLEIAIKQADAEMYRAKQQSKCSGEKDAAPFIPPALSESSIRVH